MSRCRSTRSSSRRPSSRSPSASMRAGSITVSRPSDRLDFVILPIPLRSHLPSLENDAIHVLREVAAQCARPALLFSGGKDSIVVAWLARKAFAPAPVPFPLLHIDTGHNFAETLRFRDEFARQM